MRRFEARWSRWRIRRLLGIAHMSAEIPDAQELGKLPIRALIAYAARAARRASGELRGVLPAEVLENAIRVAEAVSTTEEMAATDASGAVSAGHRVAKAYADAPSVNRSASRVRAVFRLVQATLATYWALRAASSPPAGARALLARAASSAARSARPIRPTDTRTAAGHASAARQDYDSLLREYGSEGKQPGDA
jgi:hypothetical protein